MNSFRPAPALAGLLLGCLLAAACSDKPTPTAGKRPKFGLSMDSFVVERWVRDRDIFVSEAQSLGAEVLVQVANEDFDTQVAQIGSLAASGIDVLVVVPQDSARLGPTIRQVREKGIPVLSYDRLILNAGCDLYLSHDAVAAGILMGKAVTGTPPAGGRPLRLMVVNGAKPDFNSTLISQGLHSILNPLAQAGRLDITSEIWLEAWSSEEAERRFRPLLAQTAAKPDAVVAPNDLIAEALIRCLSQKAWLDGTVVTGMDADLAACQRLVEGTQTMTVYKPIAPLATTAARYALKLARKQPLEVPDTIQDGSGPVPVILLQPVAVTAQNLTQVVVGDGFHSQQEISRGHP